MSSSKDGKVSSFHLFPRCLFQWDGGFSQRIKFHDFIASQALGAVAPLCMGVGSKDAVPAGFPKKNSGPTPEGPSIRTGTGAGHRPLWCPTMALKIKIPGGPGGPHPGASFPVPTRLASGKCGSICEGRGRPRMISTAFVVKKGGGPQAKPCHHLPVFYSLMP